MQREMSNIWKDGMLGLIVGDALGVPWNLCQERS